MRRALCITLFATALTSGVLAQECKPELSCEEFKKCRGGESWRLPIEKVKGCIYKGTPPPNRWKRMEGKGGYTTGGIGNLNFGTLNSPFYPEVGSGDGSGDRGGGSGGGGSFPNPLAGFPPGPGSSDPADCSTYKSPYLIEGCDLLGVQQPVSKAPLYGCGYAVQLDHHWAVLKKDSKSAAITIPGDNRLQVYHKKGSDLQYRQSSPTPNFYCVLKETGRFDPITGLPIRITEKVFVTPNQHYGEFDSDTKHLPITVQYQEGTWGSEVDGGFLIMTHTGGGNFVPPPPNPEYFIAQGAIDVDPQCYSIDRLLTYKLPDGFGNILFGNQRYNQCDSDSLWPHSFLRDEPERCMPFRQYYNSAQDNMYIPPTSSASTGRIKGGNAYTKYTVKAGGSRFVATADGSAYYDGPMLKARDVYVYLGTGNGRYNEQAFPDGVTFTINDKRLLRVNPPGRIRLYNDFRMQLIDGGTVEDREATILNVVAPKSYVRFPKDRPVKGYTSGTLAAPQGTLIPTNEENISQMPYDSRLDVACEAP